METIRDYKYSNSRVMAEKAAQVMEEFGFCPTWGFIQPEPLEDLGQHFQKKKGKNFKKNSLNRWILFPLDSAGGGFGGGEIRPRDIRQVSHLSHLGYLGHTHLTHLSHLNQLSYLNHMSHLGHLSHVSYMPEPPEMAFCHHRKILWMLEDDWQKTDVQFCKLAVGFEPKSTYILWVQ